MLYVAVESRGPTVDETQRHTLGVYPTLMEAMRRIQSIYLSPLNGDKHYVLYVEEWDKNKRVNSYYYLPEKQAFDNIGVRIAL